MKDNDSANKSTCSFITNISLDWPDCDRAVLYDVRLWKKETGSKTLDELPEPKTALEDLTASVYVLSEPFEAETTYLWQVVAKNRGGVTAGPEWEFSTGVQVENTPTPVPTNTPEISSTPSFTPTPRATFPNIPTLAPANTHIVVTAPTNTPTNLPEPVKKALDIHPERRPDGTIQWVGDPEFTSIIRNLPPTRLLSTLIKFERMEDEDTIFAAQIMTGLRITKANVAKAMFRELRKDLRRKGGILGREKKQIFRERIFGPLSEEEPKKLV